MYLFRYIILATVLFIMPCPFGFAEVVGTVTDCEPSLYAIVRIDKKDKLFMKGDMFCSEIDITKCLRIQDIKKDRLILNGIDSNETVTVNLGERIPLEGLEMLFEKTVEADVIEYRYKNSAELERKDLDFSVKNLHEKKIVLEKDIFNSPKTREAGSGRIKASLFEGVEIKKVKDGVWSIDSDSVQKAMAEAGGVLISAIRAVEPSFRFGQGPSLRFNCELGGAVLDKNGFFVKNLAVATLAEKVGLRDDDLIKSINGQAVNSLYGIYRAYMAVKSDAIKRIVRLDIIRDGEPRTLIYNIR